MTDFLKSNPMALRHFILYEVLQRTPIEKAYSKFCKVIGDNFMEYQEFDFWYYRFINGEYDSNFERVEDKKVYELSDMPIVVMEKILRKLDIIDRIALSKTSRSLQTFVEDRKLFHHTLKLTVLDGWTNVSFGESVDIQYIENYCGCKKILKNRETLVPGVAYWKQAFLDLKSFLKNPKLHLDTLHIESEVYDEHVSNNLEDVFKFTHNLNVKNLIIEENSLEKIPNIIPSLKPGYLLTIKIDIFYPEDDSMEKLFEMKQWKQAERFTTGKACFRWSPRHLYHFKEFHVTVKDLSLEDIREMKEVLFKSPVFEKCSLTLFGANDTSIFKQEFGNALREDPYIYQYPIPNSADYFEIEVKYHNFEHHIEVTRKKR